VCARSHPHPIAGCVVRSPVIETSTNIVSSSSYKHRASYKSSSSYEHRTSIEHRTSRRRRTSRQSSYKQTIPSINPISNLSNQSSLPSTRAMSQRACTRSSSRGPVQEETIEPPAPISLPAIRRSEKRKFSSQLPSGSSPSTFDVPSSPRTTTASTELNVASVRLIKPKVGEEWFQGIFKATLPNKQKCYLKTNKDIWVGRQCNVVMSRLRGTMMEKAKNTGLEDNLRTDLCMTHEMPWQKAWLLFENEVLQLQMASINQSYMII